MKADGTWRLAIGTPVGKQYGNLTLRTDGKILDGRFQDDDGDIDSELFEGSVDGTELTWKFKITKPVKMTLTFWTTLADDAMSGKVKTGVFGKFAVTGTRV
ncbi:hypothetical protein [Actinomadura sp. WMMA1423]|uniref:hypothetical protein n=1 Tax=Actinomadura sp. WMMA1423 TaxID=2591108 RepID=UPI0011464EDB|nr:hypothetical protein [Actinomadura sp. WMMA1423]